MKTMTLFACLCLAVLVLAAPAFAEVSITGSVDGMSAITGLYLENGGSGTPSCALRFPLESGDKTTSADMIAFARAYFDGHKPGHVILSGLVYVAGQGLRHGAVYAVARGRDTIPTTRAEWELVGRLGLGAELAGGKVHLALCWRPSDLDLTHPDGIMVSGVVWSN